MKNRMLRTSAVPLILMLVFTCIPQQMVTAGSQHLEKVAEFQSGLGENITLGPEGIHLSYAASEPNKWTCLVPKGTSVPSARSEAAMDFDEVSKEIILFGGLGQAGALNDTWKFNRSTGCWTEMKPATAPPARYHSSMVYDKAHDAMVLFGGSDGASVLADTWVYYPSNNTWIRKSPVTYPSARCKFTMVYYAAAGETVLFGGSYYPTSGTLGLTDTWSYNLTVNNWTNRNPPSNPVLRCLFAMGYDSSSEEVILFGGCSSDWYSDTWKYNYSSNLWQDLNAIPPPSARGHCSMVYKAAAGEFILFGGFPALDDTWSYNRTTNKWTLKTPVAKPTGRAGYTMAYDPHRDEVILLGGSVGFYSSFLDDMWIYDAKSYLTNGSFNSWPVDINGTGEFGKVSWNADDVSNTSVRLQFRTADTLSNLTGALFGGPDGTGVTCYETSGQQLNPVHDGDRYFQYRLLLDTADANVTPLVREVQIDYNLLHNLTLLSPALAGRLDGTVEIKWNATDRDNDSLLSDIILESNTTKTTLRTNLTAQSWSYDTNSTPNGTYRIRIITRDDNLSIPLSVNTTSGWFEIHHNGPPGVSPVWPPDNATVNQTFAVLNWSGSDPENDTVSYFVYLDNSTGTTRVSFQNGTSYNATGLVSGQTYRWAVLPFDGKSNGSISPLRRFTVNITPPNRAPVIASIPEQNATVGAEFVYAVNASDPDISDHLTFKLDAAPVNLTIDTGNGTIRWTPNLSDVGTHDVTVNVSDGKASCATSFVINVPKPFVNHAPALATIMAQNITAGTTFSYNVVASDEDNDTLNFSLDQSPTGMAINRTTGRLEWTPDKAQQGVHPVRVSVSDGRLSCLQAFNITVTVVMPVNHEPSIISEPPQTLIEAGKTFVYHVGANDTDGDIVNFTLLRAPAGVIFDNGTGYIEWTPKKNQTGTFTFTVVATDGRGGRGEQNITLEVTKVTTPPTVNVFENLWPLIVLVVAGTAVGIGAIFAFRKKKSVKPQEKKDTGTAEKPGPGEEIPEETASNPPPSPPESVTESNSFGSAEVATAPVQVAAADEKPDETRAPPAGETAVDPFEVEEVFLVYRDGRLIKHSTVKKQESVDKDLVGSMLTAIQGFVKESFKRDECLEGFSFSNYNIRICTSEHLSLAAAVSGTPPKALREEMDRILEKFEGLYSGILPTWDGDVAKFKDAKLTNLFRLARLYNLRIKVAQEGISVRSGIEFFGGYVRLKIAVINETKMGIMDGKLVLNYEKKALKLARVEPDEFRWAGDTIETGSVKPKVKKTVSVYFDPLVCTESYVDVLFTYYDAAGKMCNAQMKRKPVDIACPLFYTDESVNTALLKQAVEKADYREYRKFEVPSAYDKGKGVIERHHVKLVREFEEAAHNEAWYYGRTKEDRDELVLLVRGNDKECTVMVASRNLAYSTGLLAEIGRDMREKGARTVLDDATLKDVLDKLKGEK